MISDFITVSSEILTLSLAISLIAFASAQIVACADQMCLSGALRPLRYLPLRQVQHLLEWQSLEHVANPSALSGPINQWQTQGTSHILVWSEERLEALEDFILFENSSMFPFHLFEAKFGKRYHIIHLRISPEDIGWPVTRRRLWVWRSEILQRQCDSSDSTCRQPPRANAKW